MQNSALAETWTPFEPDVMDIAGRLDDGTAPAVEEDALLCIQSGARRMVMDCRDLTYITASGLRMMLAVAQAMQKVGGSLAVCELQPQVEEMFRVSGFSGIIPIFDSRAEATMTSAG